jgi:hypothetical protein
MLSNAQQIHWTPSLIADRLEEAADVLKRMPPVKMKGYFSTWPQIVPEFSDLIGQEPHLKCPLPSPAAISRMDETLGWTVGLEPTEAKIVFFKARRFKWNDICWRVGMARANAHLHWVYALCLIVWRLNGQKINSEWSIQKVISMTTPNNPLKTSRRDKKFLKKQTGAKMVSRDTIVRDKKP